MIDDADLDKVLPIASVPSEEEIATIFKAGYSSMIKSADEWRPLARHVRSLILACLKGDRLAGKDE